VFLIVLSFSARSIRAFFLSNVLCCCPSPACLCSFLCVVLFFGGGCVAVERMGRLLAFSSSLYKPVRSGGLGWFRGPAERSWHRSSCAVAVQFTCRRPKSWPRSWRLRGCSVKLHGRRPARLGTHRYAVRVLRHRARVCSHSRARRHSSLAGRYWHGARGTLARAR
jgi:hypothetical protein